MFADLNVFRMAYALATHASRRQAVIAQNLANADTPKYRARDIAPFAETYRAQTDAEQMRGNRPGHIDAAPQSRAVRNSAASDLPMDPNGNTVSLELELMRSVEAKQQHDRALAIYRSSMNILRTSLGRG